MIVRADGVPLYRIAICIPCQDQVSAGFAIDLARLIRETTMERPDIVLTVIMNRGTIIPQQRASLVLLAQQFAATHLLWIDADMRFPKDGLLRLLARQQSIIAANYARRREPILPVAERKVEGYLFTDASNEGTDVVNYCGMGFMLVDMTVYAAMPQPWFALGYNRDDATYVGEDVFFCQQAGKHGFETLIDHAVSQDVRHCGDLEFTHAHTHQTRAAYFAQHAEVAQ